MFQVLTPNGKWQDISEADLSIVLAQAGLNVPESLQRMREDKTVTVDTAVYRADTAELTFDAFADIFSYG